MTAPRLPRRREPEKNDPPSTHLSLPIGPAVIEVLDLAYRARRPILLEGPTGIGKSQIVTEFAKACGLQVVILDLSLLEPPDLIGLPVIEGGRTRYASPAELPVSGRGILMMEELNRAEIPVMQPALQLLSARRLHAYELPPDWICAAAINPEDEDYQVNRLDPALRSRFLQLSVRADRETWLSWAARANVHPVIARLVRDHDDVFEQASPRSWTYASDLLLSIRPEERGKSDLLRVALRGYLPTPWAIAATEALANYPTVPDLDPDALFGPDGEATLARIVGEFESHRRIDAVAMIAARMRHLFAGSDFGHRVDGGAVTLATLEKLLAPLPGDFRDQCLETAVESPAAPALLRRMGHDPADLIRSYARSPLRAEVPTWRREMKLHRVRLVVVGVCRWLDLDGSLGPGPLEGLASLVEDAGPLAEDLVRRLRARGLALEGRRAL